MNKYKVFLEEIRCCWVTVEAEDTDEAEELAIELHDEGESTELVEKTSVEAIEVIKL